MEITTARLLVQTISDGSTSLSMAKCCPGRNEKLYQLDGRIVDGLENDLDVALFELDYRYPFDLALI
jgi:hypothetical protein